VSIIDYGIRLCVIFAAFSSSLAAKNAPAGIGVMIRPRHMIKGMNRTLPTSAIGKNMMKDYLKKLLEASFHGDAREESYYSTLEDLLIAEVRAYRVGGYRVCEKWLKDRKGRALTPDEIRPYCRLVTALQKTTVIQEAIEPLYEQVDSFNP
jgi:hypothetical protein